MTWPNRIVTEATTAQLTERCRPKIVHADSRQHVSHLIEADLARVNLAGASLVGATLMRADLTDADLTGCRVYGISAWDLKLDGTKQQDLVITEEGESTLTVDNIEVAQFIYLLLNYQKIRQVIDKGGADPRSLHG